MKKVALIWGSDTGMTEEIVTVLQGIIGSEKTDYHNVYDGSLELFDQYDHLILGLSTWYDGELQSDWDEFFEQFKEIDFSNKKIAIFGLGDQEGYAEYFVDGIGIIGEVVVANGGQLVGKWKTEGYDYEFSKGEFEPGYFAGLAIDEDNQSDLTDERLEKWVRLLENEGFWE
jgi:flavodoxin I